MRRASSARSRPIVLSIASNGMFSSWPVSAFVAGVKIGGSRRSDSRSPGGSVMPQTAPVAL